MLGGSLSDRPDPAAELDSVRRTFEAWGKTDPLHAALTTRGLSGNRWDPERFFAHGRAEISAALADVAALGLAPGRARALDLGCGAGRLTQALADHFDEVVGVDIAESMVELAGRMNRHGDRVRYLVNTAPDLAALASSSFDFAYTNKVLQHVPPRVQEVLVAELIRVLRPGGIAVFQTRTGPRLVAGSLSERLYTLRHRTVRRLWKRLRGLAPYEMHGLARDRVEEIVGAAGAKLVQAHDLSSGKGKSLRYCAVKR